jgi:endonuclease/exonuclease/phosphatase family metal-dependent hydrolase
VALVVRLERPDARPLTVIATHLQYAGLDAVRALQLARLAALARAERAAGRDVVVLGDFNMDPSEARPVLEGVGMAPAAGTGQGDDAALDQIWVDARLTLLSSELVPTLGVSDHEWAGRAEVR